MCLFLCHGALADDIVAALPAIPSQATLYLDLTVNGTPAEKVVPVKQVGQELHVHTDDLQAAGVSIPSSISTNKNWLSLERAPEVQYRYDPHALLLEVTVPPHWFAAQNLDEKRQNASSSVSSAGAALNYAAHVVDREDQAKMGSLWSEWRMFNTSGVFTHTGLYRYVAREEGWSDGELRHRGYVRFDTTWISSNEDQLQTWTIGDLISSSQSWSTPVRLAGIQVARDFRLRPDVITYPVPQFSGQTALPSTLDLFINGQRVRSEQLRPGPYTISSVPFVTGAGEATLVTTDVLGRQIVTTLPFYASSDLLRAGLTDYSVSLGAMRRDYGSNSFSYGRFASAGSLRYGMTNALTIESQAELAPARDNGFGLLGMGAVMKMGMLGLVSGSASCSVYDHRRGWQWSYGYRYTNRGVNFGYQGIRSTNDFRSLATVDIGARPLGTDSDIVTAGISSARIGSAAISYVRVQSAKSLPARYLNLSYAKPVTDSLSLRIAASRDLQRREDLLTTQFLASFGSRGNVTLGTERGRSSREQLRYTRSVPSSGGIGWNVGQASDGGRSQRDASLIWSGRYARVETGTASDTDQSIAWTDLRGSLLIMENDVFASRPVSDAFVVVSTDGVSDVPVRYENQLVGYTNRRGRLLVPWVTSHYPAKFSIDPTHLPTDITIMDAEQRLAVKRRSGALLSFDVRRTRGVLIKLVERDGAVVPVGSHAQDRLSGQAGTVGYDGLVYFENLPSRIELHVRRPDGVSCHADIDLSLVTSGLTQLGPTMCEPAS